MIVNRELSAPLESSGAGRTGGDEDGGAEGPPVLHELSFEIPAGQTYGIYVTNTGCCRESRARSTKK